MEKKFINHNKFKNIIYIIIGLYFVTMPFISRFILVKLPKDLNQINLIFIVIFILINFFCIYKTLKLIFNFNFKQIKIIKVFYEFYINAIKNIDNIIKHKYLGQTLLGKILMRIATFLYKRINDHNSLLIFFMLDMLPKLCFISIFIFDIYIKQQLCYIYFYGGIVLLPSIFSYILYTLKEFALTNIDIIYKNYLLFYNKNYDIISYDNFLESLQKTSLNKTIKLQEIKYITLVKDVKEHYNTILDFYINQIYIFINIYTSIIFFDQLKTLYLYKFFLLIHYIFLACIWLYILFFNIF